jgi:hypothetical protein
MARRAPAAAPGEAADDPFLILAGTDQGNYYRRKRAIVQLEQIEMANAARIRELTLESHKLRITLKRLRAQAEQTNRIESRFEQLSSIIMDSQFMAPAGQPEEDESDSA